MKHFTLTIAALFFAASSLASTVVAEPPERRFTIPSQEALVFVFSVDSNTVIAGESDGSVRIWDITTGTGRELQKFERPAINPVSIVTNLPEGARITTRLLEDNTIGVASLTALEVQRQEILEFIKPGFRYDGWWTRGTRTGRVTFVFNEYVGADQSAINGIYYLTDFPAAWRPFQMQLNPSSVEENPIRGEMRLFTADAEQARRALTGEAAIDARQLFEANVMRFGIVDGKLVGHFARGRTWSGYLTIDLGTPKTAE